ncbi:MAG: prolyl oligopeptidase family serine peptidase, partial [Myxococcota bacterium]
GDVYYMGVDPSENEPLFVYENFITPPSVLRTTWDGTQFQTKTIFQKKAAFAHKDLVVLQHWATSKDGTRVPYFLVHRKGLRYDGSHPTLQYGYGGFEVPMVPNYNAALGRSWLGRGGVYVLANIRGGGEFGAEWHRAALKEKRQNAFDDFIAISEDLIRRKVTSPKHLAIMGGSNGGLLVSAVMVQRPDLYKAVVCQVPLTDMLRYHKLLAGASWMGEYGNPEDSKERTFLEKYSPFHNVKRRQRLPMVLFVTSTKDDRVHPGHARRMAAKMGSMWHSFLYYEPSEGGHAAGSDNQARAKRMALEYTFLWEQLTKLRNFKDMTEDQWAKDYISWLQHWNYISGYQDGSFQPNKSLSRAELAVMIAKILKPAATRQLSKDFSDVPSKHWAYEAVRIAYEGGYLSGYPDGTFQPNATVTQQQLYVSLASGLFPKQKAGLEILEQKLSDVGVVSGWAKQQIANALANKLIFAAKPVRGKAVFRPQVKANRAVAAAAFFQALVALKQHHNTSLKSLYLIE